MTLRTGHAYTWIPERIHGETPSSAGHTGLLAAGRTLNTLRAAGWFPGRRVDLTSRFKEWASVGMTFSGVVPGFLAEFYDLHLKVKLADGRDWHVDFEPMKAFDDYLDVVLDEEHRADLREMNDLIKGTVSIIGQTDALLLLMCDKGLTFGLPPEQVYWCRIGYNVEDSLERLCGSDGYFQWEPFGV